MTLLALDHLLAPIDVQRLVSGSHAALFVCGAALTLSACRPEQGTGVTLGSGSVIWTASGDAFGQPAATDALVFFGTRDHQVVAVDRAGGAERWRTSTLAYTAQTLNGFNVLLAAGTVIFGDYVVYGLDPATGVKRWVFDPERQGIPGFAPGAYTLTTDGTRVFTGSGSGHAYAINASDGTLGWVTPLAVDGHSSVYDPVFDDQTVYVVVRHFTNPITGSVVALDRATGAVRWSHDFPPEAPTGSGPLGRVVLHGDLVFASNDDGRIYALDRTTGVTQWTIARRPDVEGYDDSRPLILAGDVLIAGSLTFYVNAYDATSGLPLWEVNPFEGASGNPMATDGGTVYVPFTNGRLHALDVATGQRRWDADAPAHGSFRPFPLVVDSLVLAPSSTGLVAFRK